MLLALMRRRTTTVILATALAFAVGEGRAQGVVGATLRGRVVGSSGAPVAGSAVTLSNVSTGAVRRTSVGERGVFLFDNLPVGGPYRLEARAIGYVPATIDSIVLHLGDQVDRILLLGERRTLDAMIVRGAVGQRSLV